MGLQIVVECDKEKLESALEETRVKRNEFRLAISKCSKRLIILSLLSVIGFNISFLWYWYFEMSRLGALYHSK